jgi:hypothetical protein
MCRGIIRGETCIVKQEDKTSEEDKVEPKLGTMSADHPISSDLSSEDEESSEPTMNDSCREKVGSGTIGASLGDRLKIKCILPCPLLFNTPKDILDEIISTFGSKRSAPEACEFAGRCA